MESMFTAAFRGGTVPFMSTTRGGTTDTDVVALYERRFAALAEVAAEMDIAPDDAAELIDDILLASLVKRRVEDVDAFLVAAFRAAVDCRKGHVS